MEQGQQVKCSVYFFPLQEMKRVGQDFEALDGKSFRCCIKEYDLDGEWPEKYRRAVLPCSLFDETNLMGVESKRQPGLLSLETPPSFHQVIIVSLTSSAEPGGGILENLQSAKRLRQRFDIENARLFWYWDERDDSDANFREFDRDSVLLNVLRMRRRQRHPLDILSIYSSALRSTISECRKKGTL